MAFGAISTTLILNSEYSSTTGDAILNLQDYGLRVQDLENRIQNLLQKPYIDNKIVSV